MPASWYKGLYPHTNFHRIIARIALEPEDSHSLLADSSTDGPVGSANALKVSADDPY